MCVNGKVNILSESLFIHFHRFLSQGLTVLVFILSIAGIAVSGPPDVKTLVESAATAGTGKVQQDIFISITVFSLIAILIALYVKFSGSGDASKYEVSYRNSVAAL